MKILAIDTTANTAACALVEDGRVKGVSTVDGILTHSETMLPMIDELLKRLAIAVSDLDAFAVAEGPGSFTGVRIGVSTIKGLAFSTNKPCIGVSSLAGLAFNLDGFDGLVVPVMDARRQQVYTAIYNEGNCVFEDALIPLSELADELAKYEFPIRLVGDGYQLAERYLTFDERISQRIKATPAALIPHNAASIALLAEKMAIEKCFSTDLELHPLYLRDSQAERERKEGLTNNFN